MSSKFAKIRFLWLLFIPLITQGMSILLVPYPIFRNTFLSFFFWTSLIGHIAWSLLGGGVPTQKSGYRDIRLCPYIVLVYYCSIPWLYSRPGVSSCATTYPNFSSSLSDSAVASSFTPYISIPSSYHHQQDTQSPGLQTDRSQSSRVGCVTIYCATIFCLLVI